MFEERIPVDGTTSPLLATNLSFETGNYWVTHYHGNPDKLIIVFISAGRQTPGGAPIEEFRNSLRSLDASVLFVADRHLQWFNYAETDVVFARIAAIAENYKWIGSMGESMGGCGALLATKYTRRISRVLAMSPQYSIASPFIRFDLRYESIGRSIPQHFHAGFALPSLPPETALIFGNTEWADYIHAMSYAGHHLDVIFVEDATHNVAAFLKSLNGNMLVRLLELFADFTKPFVPSEIRNLLFDNLAKCPLQVGKCFTDLYTHRQQLLENIDEIITAQGGIARSPKISLGKTASQSSVCSWSRNPASTAEDARGAISGEITGQYSFHTDQEQDPWWAVDLHQPHLVDEIRIFNFIAHPGVIERTSQFVLESSIDKEFWTIFYERTDKEPFGGADGKPFVWRATKPLHTRHIRIRLTAMTYLHLDQVEVFGYPV